MTAPLSDRAGRGRLGAYLVRYQLRDFLMLRAGVPALMVTLLGFMLWKTTGSGQDWATPQGERFSREIFKILSGMFIALGGFMGVARLVTDDRALGSYRLLLSKPVALDRFYIQQWLLHGAGLVVITGLFSAWLQAGTGPLPVRDAMLVMGLFWVLLGGIGFALSAATNADAVLLVLLYVVSSVLHSIKDMPNSPMWPWLRQVTRLSPPFHKLDYVRDVIYSGGQMPWMHVAHVCAYGALAFAVGWVILRRVSFAR